MSVMYFAKLNMSSDIYEFYERPELYYQFLDKMYSSINSDHSIVDEFQMEYKFNSLIKDYNNKSITGRLSKIFNGSVEKYDRKKDEPVSRDEDDLSSTISFHFDVNSEIILYIAARDFGYKQFLDKFTLLVESILKKDNIKIELNLLISTEDLKKKVKGLREIEEISITLIPPNPPNKEEFKELFGERSSIIYESKTTKYHERFESKSKITGSLVVTGYIERVMDAIGKGYGKFIAKGFNDARLSETVSSDEDAPLKLSVQTKEKNNLLYIKETAENSIRNLRYKDSIKKEKEKENENESIES